MLIGASFAVGGGLLGGALAKNLGAIAFVKNIGFALAIGGVSQMLYQQEKPKDFSNDQDPRISFSFSGVQNTSRAGTTHPIVYGEIFTGSVVISAGIDTNQVSA